MRAKTVLNQRHRALGAKGVEFAGWVMPIHSGSQMDERHLLRREAGMFDVSPMTVIDVYGPRTRQRLRYVLANSGDTLKLPGEALDSCRLDERGGVIEDLITSHGSGFLPAGRQWGHPEQGSSLDRCPG